MNKTDNVIPSGYILLNKQAGVTSFNALAAVKRALGTGKVGHTGTLDKFAEGLLVVLAGRALKLSSLLSGLDKRYSATIRFGEETDTLDPEGAVIASAPPPSEAAVRAVLPEFTGMITQRPPVYSAIHVNGSRASALARAGKPVELPVRNVTIYELALLSYQLNDADGGVNACADARVEAACSSGTYIRALARDMALAAGSRAHLTALTRTAVGGFSLADAVTLKGDADDAGVVRAALREPDETFFEMTKTCYAKVKYGNN
jgi:tRNA pseudouridine55 synthase